MDTIKKKKLDIPKYEWDLKELKRLAQKAREDEERQKMQEEAIRRKLLQQTQCKNPS